jgi:ATP-dependent helicase/nuclease subunit A
VSLAGALRSSVFNLEDETLFWLARHPQGLGAGLLDTPPAVLSAAQQERVRFAAGTLADLRKIKDRTPVAQLIQEAMERTGYDAVLLAEFLGERKLANLRKLVDQARGFDRSGIFSLADFITQLSQFVARQPDEPLAATSPESADVVRLMTVHQSKGLEFPVVVVPDLDRRTRGSGAPAAFTPELGPLVKTPSGASGYDLYAAVEKIEEHAELMRLLYVATTRAADYLILSSGVSELGSARGPWTDLLSRRFDLVSGELRVPLPPGYPRPRVKVTTSEPPLRDATTKGRRSRDLDRLADKAAALAEKGAGRTPPHTGPVAPDLLAQRQYSFSRLTGQLYDTSVTAETEEMPPGPAQLDPRGLGTLVHAALAEIHFKAPQDVGALVRRLAPRHLPKATAPDLDEPVEMIRRFLDSSRAGQIASADRAHQELEFLIVWPPSDAPPQTSPRYLQGFIDCLYRDPSGDWHVVDYKTNRVSRATLQAAAAPYEMQMHVYALAVERIFGREPKSLVLHFLRPGLEHHFPWDAAARKRVVERIDRCIASCQSAGRATAG